MNREITCIVCPNGCTLNIDFEKNADGKIAVTSVSGNLCPRGRDYAVQGDSFWNLFHVKERSEHEWHYRGLADALRELSGTFAFEEFENLINQVFNGSD